MAPRKAINTVKLFSSTFKLDNWDGFKIINIPNQPIRDAIISSLVIFSLIRIPANIDMNIGYVYWITVEMFRGIFRIAKKMQTNAIVPKKPLKINNGLFLPQGSIFLLFIIKDVINKLTNDLIFVWSNWLED